jgi:hypothetical protein
MKFNLDQNPLVIDLYRRNDLDRSLNGFKERTGRWKTRSKNIIKQVAAQELVSPIVYRENSDGSRELMATKRSKMEKHSGEQEFPLVEHVKQLERIKKRFRKKRTLIVDVALRGLKEELFHKSRISQEELYSCFKLESAWRFPFEVPLKIRSKSIYVPVNLYTVILRQMSDVQFSLNKKEIEDVRYLKPHECHRIKPQILRYAPPSYQKKLEELIDKTLLGIQIGKWDFGKYNLTLEYPAEKVTDLFVVLPCSSARCVPSYYHASSFERQRYA